jgi:hypothetical protein
VQTLTEDKAMLQLLFRWNCAGTAHTARVNKTEAPWRWTKKATENATLKAMAGIWTIDLLRRASQTGLGCKAPSTRGQGIVRPSQLFADLTMIMRTMVAATRLAECTTFRAAQFERHRCGWKARHLGDETELDDTIQCG